MSPSVLFIGSSHVKRFERYIRDNDLLHYNVDQRLEVNFFGISGGRITQSSHVRMLQDAIQRHRPDILFVQIGGNDLDQPGVDSAQAIAFKLLSLGMMWKTRYHIKSVVIGQFMFRTRTRTVTPEQYNELVLEANKLLKAESDGNRDITVWSHKGLKNPTSPCLLDGVHLNHAGLHKFYRNTRGAILQCLKKGI